MIRFRKQVVLLKRLFHLKLMRLKLGNANHAVKTLRDSSRSVGIAGKVVPSEASDISPQQAGFAGR